VPTPQLKKFFDLTVSGRDWCNVFEEISQQQIDQMQENALKKIDRGIFCLVLLYVFEGTNYVYTYPCHKFHSTVDAHLCKKVGVDALLICSISTLKGLHTTILR
jgi:hypothetical protein